MSDSALRCDADRSEPNPLPRRRATRRRWLRGAAAGLAGALSPPLLLQANPVSAQELVGIGEQQPVIERTLVPLLGSPLPPLRDGRVKLEVPQLADNGNSVPCRVIVDSPMTSDDHVKAIHLVLPRNPRPFAISVFPAPDAPQAMFETRIRLAATQRLVAVAVMNDNSCWTAAIDVIVSVSACVDGS